MGSVGRFLVRAVVLAIGAGAVALWRRGKAPRPSAGRAVEPPATPEPAQHVAPRHAEHDQTPTITAAPDLHVSPITTSPDAPAFGTMGAPAQWPEPRLADEIARALQDRAEPMTPREIVRALGRLTPAPPPHAVDAVLRDHPDRFTHVGGRRYALAGSPEARRWLVREIFGRGGSDES
ncbi:MAG: hypothetical protein HY660_05925 [Armatimonadetes bacterium]|nr:hypothetical protein [Armatimonadota bacterium]